MRSFSKGLEEVHWNTHRDLGDLQMTKKKSQIELQFPRLTEAVGNKDSAVRQRKLCLRSHIEGVPAVHSEISFPCNGDSASS